jgi:autophagy-related protein 9
VETDTPYGYDPGVMIQIVPEAGKSKWSHIDDLDSFFTKVYEYHQKHGFTVMMLQELLELIQFIFMIMFTVFLIECVDYPLLFKEQSHETNIFYLF